MKLRELLATLTLLEQEHQDQAAEAVQGMLGQLLSARCEALLPLLCLGEPDACCLQTGHGLLHHPGIGGAAATRIWQLLEAPGQYPGLHLTACDARGTVMPLRMLWVRLCR
jgi:hypothetical protein